MSDTPRPVADRTVALESWGLEEDPAVLVLHDGRDGAWRGMAERLTQAGRRVLALEGGAAEPERAANPRARSAKLRAAVRTEAPAWRAAA